MRKGLTVTLMTVAVAIMAMSAMAEAPVIGDIPSPVVGDWESVTPANIFVFPDAINLNSFVTDDKKAPPQIKWSYEIAATPLYLINGVATMTGSDDPISPPGDKVINTQVLGGEENPDNKTETITIRNIHLSPLGVFWGDYTDDGATTGVMDSQTQWVTFYASDGSTVSEKAVQFYTANNEYDHLSAPYQSMYVNTDPSSGTEFTYQSMGGDATSSTDGGAICLHVGAIGVNWAVWNGTYGQLPLVKNSVYRIRALVNGSQATPGTTPFWDLLVNNYDGVHGLNLYGANYFFLDNTGGANAALTGAATFEVWWNPTPISTAKWNETGELRPGPFDTEYAADKDAFIQFRVLDVNNSPGITADNDFGALCLNSLMIDRCDVGVLQPVLGGEGLLNVTDLTNAVPGPGNTRFNGINATGTFSGGNLTIAPIPGTNDVNDGRRALLAMVEPGNNDIPFSTDPADAAEVLDNFPVPNDPQSLYEVHFGMTAPSSADEGSPPDVFWLGADTNTNETIYMTYVTSNAWGKGMPAYSATQTPQDYKCFFYSNGGTVASNPSWWQQFRPRFMLGNAARLGLFQSEGAITIHYYSVDKIKIP